MWHTTNYRKSFGESDCISATSYAFGIWLNDWNFMRIWNGHTSNIRIFIFICTWVVYFPTQNIWHMSNCRKLFVIWLYRQLHVALESDCMSATLRAFGMVGIPPIFLSASSCAYEWFTSLSNDIWVVSKPPLLSLILVVYLIDFKV